MVEQQTIEKLYAMKLQGLAEAYEEQRQHPQSGDLSFDERLALLVERQWIWKENRALATRLRYAAHPPIKTQVHDDQFVIRFLLCNHHFFLCIGCNSKYLLLLW